MTIIRTTPLLTSIVLALISANGLLAQITGDIEVKVIDPSTASVSGAAVTARSLDTGSVRTVTTSADGSVRIPLLNVGKYEVEVNARGFAPFKTPVDVNSGRVSDVKATLEVQSTTQAVVVSEEAAAINTTNAQLQTVFSSRDIVELPVNTNTAGILTFAATAPGVVPQTPNNNSGFLGYGNFSSNGGRTRGANITVDNATATDVSTTGGSGLGTFPIDAVKEVSFITNNFNAEYGRNSSAQYQIVTKSGTNDFHGRLFEFFRNDKLNARSFFDQTGSADITRNNDWGAVVGGRIIKDKIFWLGTYEQTKVRGAGAAVIATVPTPQQVSAITNPTSKALFASSGGVSSPSGSISNSAPNTTNTRAFGGRLDFNFTQKDTLFVRGGVSDLDAFASSQAFITSNLVGNGVSQVGRDANITSSYTHVFSPVLVNNFLASYGRNSPNFTPIAKTLGPAIFFNDGFDALGGWSGAPQGRVQNTFQYLDTITYSRGNHSLKAGYELNRIQSNGSFDSNVRGTLTFNSFADFQAGNPLTYTQRFGNSVRGYRVWNNFAFVQDDWRVTRTLTLNLGLRVEVANGATEVNGLLSNLNLNSTAPMGAAGTGPLGAIQVVPVSNKQQTNWGPRLGFAWTPGGGKLVVRGGYGIAYDFSFLNPVANLRFAAPLMYQFSTTDFTGANTLANIAAGTSPFQQTGRATVGTFGTNLKSFGTLTGVDQGLRNPQVEQWNLTLEREVLNGLVLRGAYVGTKGNYLQRSDPLNFLQPGLFTPPATVAEEAALQANGTLQRLNAGLNAPPTGTTNRIDPRFGAVALVSSGANSNYHSFQFQAIQRLSHGLTLSAAYTWSKSIDNASDALGVLLDEDPLPQNPFNSRDNRAVSAFDVPQRFVLSHTYDLPWFKDANKVLKQTLGGWQFSGIYVAQSGTPVNLRSGAKRGLTDALLLGTGTGTQRPDLIGPLNVQFTPNPGGGVPPNKVTNSGLAQPLVGHFGTLGRNVLRINGLSNFDWTLGKRFPITERVNVEFQAHAFNVFNHTSFALLSTNARTIATPAVFGYYDGTQSESRNLQLNLRLIW
ncbi:MAG: TonB-dependent Receptor Plug Domain protein [Bryobacterales bacterium]|nr:TonB-dependent Receptor Plug Domain protein [Bryobacterales bacterium]